MIRLGIGTVQFGQDYGIANQSGQVDDQEIARILAFAKESGIDTIDTAIGYGKSEEKLGSFGLNDFRVISKLPALEEKQKSISRVMKLYISESLDRLGIDQLDSLLLHRTEDLLNEGGEEIYSTLLRLKEEGMCKRIGVSAYQTSDVERILDRYHIDLVQVPFNIFDRRLADSGLLLKLAKSETEVHVRSIFLQGLLLMKNEDRPTYFDQWNSLWKEWEDWLLQNELTPVQACLAFVSLYREIECVIVGVQSTAQLKEITRSMKLELPRLPDHLKSQDNDLINPTSWPTL